MTTILACAQRVRGRYAWHGPSASHWSRVWLSSRISTAARSQGPGPAKVSGAAGCGASAMGRVARSRLLASSLASAASTSASHCAIASNGLRGGWDGGGARTQRRRATSLCTPLGRFSLGCVPVGASDEAWAAPCGGSWPTRQRKYN